MTSTIAASLENLGREYPDWKPWLIVVEKVLEEIADGRWDPLVPADIAPRQNVPLLAKARLTLEVGLVDRWLKELLRAAQHSGGPKMASFGAAEGKTLNIPDLFEAALIQDKERLKATGRALGVDPDAFQSVADLVAVPFLHACARHWAPSGNGWTQGYCLVCGAWPALAEVRGIDRSRHLRCSRCGGDWETRWLCCPYCGTAEHEQMVSLVPETTGTTRTVEACKRCLGYVKSFTTLQGSPAPKVLLDDLASVDLDVAALEQGYKRPEGTGYSLGVVLDQPGVKKRTFPWSL